MFGNWPVTVARCDRADVRDAGLPIITVNSSLNDIDAYVRLGFLASGTMVDVEGVRFQPMMRSAGN